ncbi:MAG: lipoate--protein ligase family protein, partial [Nitrososphaerota archaeon]|nr:lipoate--protein ligase family protein [Nitrososphaerota archaeon]
LPFCWFGIGAEVLVFNGFLVTLGYDLIPIGYSIAGILFGVTAAIFRRASAPVLSSLGACGVDARLDPPNSLVTVEGKISGMAAYVSRNGLVCHGTLLVSADLARVKALTTPSPEKLERRYARSRDVRTANSLVAADSFIRTFVKTLADETKLTIARGRPDERERRLAEELLEAKYGDERWSLGDPFGWEEGPRAAAEAE